MKKVVIYGTGKVGKAFYESHNFEGEELVAFVETNPNKESFLGTNIIGIEDIGENIDIIYLANSYIDTVYECIGRGIQKQRLILENEMLCKLYCSIEGTLDIKYDYIFAMKYERQITKKDEYIVMAAMQRNLKNYGSHKMNILGNSYTESYDYNRLATLELLIEEIKQNNINGELAELRVFKGNFSKWINKEFPDKRLFLFDTFDGFDNKDIDIDIENKYSSKEWFDKVKNFEETSVSLVLGKMKHPNQVVVRKGFFPDTIPEEKLKYALVSIDCDLYMPILEGLRYFYPRVNRGGYIMLHDYNAPELRGVRQAVLDYELEIGERMVKIPIPDRCGSLIIGK